MVNAKKWGGLLKTSSKPFIEALDNEKKFRAKPSVYEEMFKKNKNTTMPAIRTEGKSQPDIIKYKGQLAVPLSEVVSIPRGSGNWEYSNNKIKSLVNDLKTDGVDIKVPKIDNDSSNLTHGVAYIDLDIKGPKNKIDKIKKDWSLIDI